MYNCKIKTSFSSHKMSKALILRLYIFIFVENRYSTMLYINFSALLRFVSNPPDINRFRSDTENNIFLSSPDMFL